MRFEAFSFGSICIDGTTYAYDVVIDRGRIHTSARKNRPRFRDRFGHTPALDRGRDTLEVPTACDRHRNRSVAGDGRGELRGSSPENQLQIMPTAEAIKKGSLAYSRDIVR